MVIHCQIGLLLKSSGFVSVMPRGDSEFINTIKTWIVFILLLVLDLVINWYLYSLHPPPPSVNHRCSSDFPEFGVKTNHMKPLPDGSLRAEDGTVYLSGTFWSEGNTVRICPCTIKHCIRKCCAIGKIFNQNHKCVPKDISHSFIERVVRSDISEMKVNKTHFSILESSCISESKETQTFSNFHLLQNGAIRNASKTFDQTKYCLEVVSDFSGANINEVVVAMFCTQQNEFEELLSLARDLKAFCVRLSATLVHLFSFLVYTVLPKLRQGVGKSLMHLTAAMALKGLFNIIVIVSYGKEYYFLCITIGLGMQYTWLASQMWQSVISYKIWSTFKPEWMRSQGTDSCEHYRHFLLSSCIAWGVPAIVSALTLTVGIIPIIPVHLKPQLGLHKCWFPNQATRFIYAVTPVIITEIINLALCVKTLLQLSSLKQISIQMQASTCRKHNRNDIEWTKIYMRLCFLMGSSYFIVTIVNLVTWNYREMWWIPPFIVNTIKDLERMRGVEIFFIFILKKYTLLQLFERFKRVLMSPELLFNGWSSTDRSVSEKVSKATTRKSVDNNLQGE